MFVGYDNDRVSRLDVTVKPIEMVSATAAATPCVAALTPGVSPISTAGCQRDQHFRSMGRAATTASSIRSCMPLN